MKTQELNNLFLNKFCSGLKLVNGNMVLTYDYNRSMRAQITVASAYHVNVEMVSEETDYKWESVLETSISLDKELSIEIAKLKPRKVQDDE